MSLGHNTIAASQLRGIVERIENVRVTKKQASLDEREIMAEAAANGFLPKAIRYVLKVREEKPHDRQEREAIQDLYLHAMGMATEPPLFRFAGLASIDINAREQVIERMKEFVPPSGAGHIDVTFGGQTWRLSRDKDGEVFDAELIAKPDKKEPGYERPPAAKREPPPEVDEAGAEALGRQYCKDNRAIIENPFPFGDPRRARFDSGWRKESGNDGMGPDD